MQLPQEKTSRQPIATRLREERIDSDETKMLLPSLKEVLTRVEKSRDAVLRQMHRYPELQDSKNERGKKEWYDWSSQESNAESRYHCFKERLQ